MIKLSLKKERRQVCYKLLHERLEKIATLTDKTNFDYLIYNRKTSSRKRLMISIMQ